MLSMGSYVVFFRQLVCQWQDKLDEVENTLLLWRAVTRHWMSLESIFIMSEDIRARLPKETKVFDELDTTFREMNLHGQASPNVLEACMVSERASTLRGMKNDME